MGEFKTAKSFVRESLYTKSISIKPVDLEYIKTTKGKKSAGGRLNEIINYYQKNYKDTKDTKK